MKFAHAKAHEPHEPPAALLTDIAFNLLIFFVVCASTEPADGRRQDIPGSSQTEAKQQQADHIEVSLTRTTASINGDQTPMKEVEAKLKGLLKGKTRVEDRVVLVKSTKDTTYERWIQITGWIEEAGGITTLQMEEEQSVQVQ